MNRTLRRRILMAALLSTALGFGGNTVTSAGAAEPIARKRSPAASNLIRAAAEVIAIDHASRVLMLKREDGNTVTVIAEGRIGNLARVSVGDIVVAQYGHARAISLKKAPAATAESDAAAEPAPVTATPAGKSRKRAIIADIIAIDDRTGEATLKGLNGEVVDVVFQNRKLLSSVRIGDRVKAEYTDAVAVAIKPAGRAIPPKRHPAP